jgi:hypothetical protein
MPVGCVFQRRFDALANAMTDAMANAMTDALTGAGSGSIFSECLL